MRNSERKKGIIYLLEFLSISIIIYGLLYSSIPVIQKKVEEEIIKYTTVNIIDAIKNAIFELQTNENEDILLKLITDPETRNELKEKLIIFDTGKITYIFILYRDPLKEKYRYILNVFDKSTSFNSPFNIIDEKEMVVVDKVYRTGKGDYFKHQKNQMIGITYYFPIIQKGMVKLIVAIDFSLQTLKEIENVASLIKLGILSLIVLNGSIMGIVIYSLFRNFLLRQKAFTDNLTGIYNRNYLESIKPLINPKNYTVVMADIDHFKQINDTYGHDKGDYVLKKFARILTENLRKNDLVFRFGGEEFLILLNTPVKNKEIIYNIIDRLRRTVEETEISGIKMTASFGIFMDTDKVNDLEDAIKRADTALYKAKEEGRNRIVFYDEEGKGSDLSIPDVIKIIENENIICYYQPVLNLKEQKVLYYEALARLQYNDEILPPLPYINLIKGTPHYANFTKLILNFNMNILKKYKNIKVGINLSSSDFLNRNIIDILLNLNPEYVSRIYLEITGGDVIKSYEPFKKSINDLVMKGYNLVLDDFGLGNTDFILLNELNVRYVKIDGSIVNKITKDENFFLIFKYISSFCKEIGKEPIAEYIENEEIYKKVMKTGVRYGQGYYFGRPLPIDRLYIEKGGLEIENGSNDKDNDDKQNDSKENDNERDS